MYIEDENISSAASFLALRKECYKISQSAALVPSVYPNIFVLAEEEKQVLMNRPLQDVAKEFYAKGQKINFIKYLREKWDNMSLMDAKILADGYWDYYNKLNTFRY